MTKVSSSRSWNMSRIRSQNTKPELLVRRLLYSEGYRYRLHARELPGKPDIVFRRHKKVIFVHGCFWHRHKECKKATTPKTRKEFWRKKFSDNILRDQRVMKELDQMGWLSLVIWECETNNTDDLLERFSKFLAT